MSFLSRIGCSIITALVSLAFCCGDSLAFPSGAGRSAAAEWTILIFMNGDNNLEPDALINFRQLARVGSTDTVNVVVQFDRIGKYAHTQPDWKQTLRFRITKGMEPLPANALEDIGEANMGDGKVLADFLTWGMQKYPAKRYMLVIWDHGQGWRLFLSDLLKRDRALTKSRAIGLNDDLVSLRSSSVLLRSSSGVASGNGETAPFRSAPGSPYRSASNDETNDDVLYNREMEDSLKASFGGKKLDVIGFDACLMSMVETAYAFQDVARYLVASEELEPGLGWKYDDWLAAIEANPTQDASALAKTTVQSYQKYYSDPNTGDPQTTMAAFDLAQAQPLAASISALGDSLSAKIDNQLQLVIEARAATSIYAPGYNFYHVDLGQFLNQLKSRTSDQGIQSQADAVLNRISIGVVANYAGTERLGSYGSNGIAIYFPSSQHEYIGDPFNEGGYEKNNTLFPVEFVQKERWSDFLHAYWSRVP